MFALSVGVSSIQATLPRAVYALLSGLNSATVGIIALAAVELSDKAVTDKLTRLVVAVSGAAGLLYNSLWYFPVLMVGSGCATVVYDYKWLHLAFRTVKGVFRQKEVAKGKDRAGNEEAGRSAQVDDGDAVVAGPSGTAAETPGPTTASQTPLARRSLGASSRNASEAGGPFPQRDPEPRVIPQEYRLNFSWRVGAAIIATFFATFIAVMATRATLPSHDRPLLFSLFANLYLAGTIIFGGGPVVIPLLREYIVAEGWVAPRDFLIGLAVAQAFPGPNFNFAVFLGGLAASQAGLPPAAGSAIAFFGIFTPGIVLVHGTMGIWPSLRPRPWVRSAVRGVNAGAVGLIFTAVYRIWQVGYVDEGFQSGRSLGDDPWWVVITTVAYVGGRYFGVAAPFAILAGAVLGLFRYAVVSR